MDKKTDEKMSVPNGGISAFLKYGIVVVLLMAFFYLLLNSSRSSPAEKPPSTLPLATPEARLLISSFERGASLVDYALEYSVNDSGKVTKYKLAKKGNESWVFVSGDSWTLEGFFGQDNKTDIVCLEYRDALRCALVGNDERMREIANGLKILLPNPEAYLAQKEEVIKLISFGALVFEGGIAQDKVGLFDAQKVAYRLDYSSLTVQQLLSLGKTPNDEMLVARKNNKVTMWIDAKTGLLAKSHATYEYMGAPTSYSVEYSEIDLEPKSLPERPAALVSPSSFLAFYTKSNKEYEQISSCYLESGQARDLCLKNNAVWARDWKLCERIADRKDRENCAIILAQITKNKSICPNLELFRDECYIEIAGATGNAEVCKELANASLLDLCEKAASGRPHISFEEEVLEPKYACNDSSECQKYGKYGQFCAKKDMGGNFEDEETLFNRCFEGLECICDGGACRFNKTEEYYECIDKVEEELLAEYLQSLSEGEEEG